jgi:pyruvate formate lyase activating enzyme
MDKLGVSSHMSVGTVFDIQEFSIHDGPGIRTVVFLKGCPLSCSWCHNPEGRLPQPQLMRTPLGEHICGKEFAPADLAMLLNKQAKILKANEGGVTFSGGEPLLQSRFVAEVIDRLDQVHVLLDTSGYACEGEFEQVATRSQMVYFDLKLIDLTAHRRYTGVTNEPILRNLRRLSAMGVPFVIRVPMIPGVTDTDANLMAIAETVDGLSGLVGIDLLPYNRVAGGKYASLGMRFAPDYDETRPVNLNIAIFKRANLHVRIV